MVLGTLGRRVENRQRLYCIIDSLRISIVRQFSMVTTLLECSNQNLNKTFDKKKWFSSFYIIEEEWVVWQLTVQCWEGEEGEGEAQTREAGYWA